MYLENAGINEDMRQDEPKATNPKSVRLPQISPITRLILIIGIVLVLAIPLYLVYSQQLVKQSELNQQLTILQKALGSTESPDVLKKNIGIEMSDAYKNLVTTKAIFPNSDQSLEIIDNLIKLAKTNGIDITKTQVAASTASIKVGTDTIGYPVTSFDINLRGQVSKFQNFLLSLINSVPSSQIKKVYFKIPEKEDEEATANLVLTVFSSDILEQVSKPISIEGKKPLVSFTDKKDKVTEVFKSKASQLRLDWKITAADPKWASFYIAVYHKDETGRYASLISRTGEKATGTEYISIGEGDFYIKVASANITNWEIKVYE